MKILKGLAGLDLINEIHEEGNLQKVFSELKTCKKNLDEGAVDNTRPVLMILSGTLRGCYGGGGVMALKQLGLTKTFHTAFGLSTGAPTVGYFLSDQPELGNSIYSEECLNNNFINLPYLLTNKNVIDMKYISDVWRGEKSTKKLDIQAIIRNPTEMLVAVTNYKTGIQYFLDPKKYSDPIKVLQASASIPILYKSEVEINNNRYIDGGISNPFPITNILHTIKPTSLLIFANRPVQLKYGLLTKILTTIFSLRLSPSLRKAIKNKDRLFFRELDTLRKSKTPYVIIWTDNKIGAMTKDKDKIILASERYNHYILDLAKRFF